MKELREALSSMNESLKNPTNGPQEDNPGAEEHTGGGTLRAVHIMVPHGGDTQHHVHAMHEGGKVHSSSHASLEEAMAKAHEHMKAHHGAHGK